MFDQRAKRNIHRIGARASRVLQGLRTNPVTINDSLKHHNRTSTKRTKKNASIERSEKEKTRTNQQQKKKEKEQTDVKRTEKKKKRGRHCNVLEEKKKKKRKQKQTSNKKKEEKKKKTVSISLVQNTSLCQLIFWFVKKGFKLIILVKD